MKRKSVLTASILAGIAGLLLVFTSCNTSHSQVQPVPQSKYVVTTIHGVYYTPQFGKCTNTYYTDDIKYDGNWMIFNDHYKGWVKILCSDVEINNVRQ